MKSVPEILRDDFRYPFPTFKNQLAGAMQAITDHEWIDGEYFRLYENDSDTRNNYKKTMTAHIVAQWLPTCSLERLRPVSRCMLWILYSDDMCEEITPAEARHIHEQSIAILRGNMTAEQAGIQVGSMLASLREELLQFISLESLEHFIAAVIKYFEGLEQELAYKVKKTFPGIEECIAIRQKSVCMFPFYELIEVETKWALPSKIYEHPVMQRLKVMASQMMVFFNDVQSLMKDEATDSIYYNVVKVIQHNLQISREEACREVLRIHNEVLKEFVALQASLPDFGHWHDAVVTHVHYIGMTLSGWKAVSAKMERYNSLNGFPAAETVKQIGSV